MCGIIGSNFHTKSQLQLALNTIQSRGPDASDLQQGFNFTLAANRLAIQKPNLNISPILQNNNSFFLYNGELWNSHSKDLIDSQLVFNIIQASGTSALHTLKGMFAFAYETKDFLLLARDKIGEIPLYYSHQNNQFCFASEKKALTSLGIKNISLLDKGSYLIFKNNEITITSYYSIPEYIVTDSKEEIIHNIRHFLTKAVADRVPQEVDYCCLLSGGIDSSINAYLLKQHNPNLQAYTVHVGDLKSSKKANDLYYARLMANFLNIPLTEIILTPENVENLLEETVYTIEDHSWTQTASGLACLALAKKIKQDNKYKVVFSGSGMDELAASYPNQKRWQWRDDQYNQARRNLINNLHKNNIIRENKCFLHESLEIRTPYLDIDFVEYFINLPIQYRFENKRMKPLLRYAFPELPQEVLWREKVAMGEGCDLDRLLKPQKDTIKQIYDKFYPR